MEDKKQAIRVLFVINQKIGYTKGSPHFYTESLYQRLQITVNRLLDNYMNQIGKAYGVQGMALKQKDE
ncbi:hypothetical protein PP175_29150 (plasmid) [Aneurinibacillus sp. Ricciae_BoGa-3]|uniref:hypothetical protein n=1 Tax=Aneurinibacillus sp. Ricciae_BoGa-3 TaxID=3022697 RepID=UPI00233FCFF7|nr:hypothetical protein [Aneurinibacillus sp. Ricciae_BoGa-3]WCK57260.1 hypothetical protein PP175_29150 [Aneurinibacillus sp. Ricciae_BoGa-3]